MTSLRDGGGRPAALENIDPAAIPFEKIGVEEVGARTSLRFRVSS